jgi:hypothetical protein
MRFRIIVATVLLSAPALAHPGEHGGFSLRELATHILEPDHILFAVLAAAVGVSAYRAGRRAEAKARLDGQGKEDRQ